MAPLSPHCAAPLLCPPWAGDVPWDNLGRAGTAAGPGAPPCCCPKPKHGISPAEPAAPGGVLQQKVPLREERARTHGFLSPFSSAVFKGSKNKPASRPRQRRRCQGFPGKRGWGWYRPRFWGTEQPVRGSGPVGAAWRVGTSGAVRSWSAPLFFVLPVLGENSVK